MAKNKAVPDVAVDKNQVHLAERFSWRLALLYGMALFITMVLGGVIAIAWWMHTASDQTSLVQQMAHELQLSQADLLQIQARLDMAEANVVVEASTRSALEDTLHESQAELARVRDQLAFFNELLPPGPAGSVSIRALDITPLGPTLQYRLLLMRSGAVGTAFKGNIQFVAQGMQNGKVTEIELQAAQTPVANGESQSPSSFSLDFSQFQRSGGLLAIPAGLTVQKVTLNILEGSTVRVSRTVKLSAVE